LILGDPQLRHQAMRDAVSFQGGLILAQHHFQLDEIAQVFHTIQVDARLASHVEPAMFADHAA
jgi:hypothetical protein